jgi:DNA-directed RNA polymerase subunit RPC12/RpoP
MDALDGNVIGGLLLEVFGTEMTAAVGTCASCGAAGQVGEMVVYLDAPGTVVRCRRCGGLLMVFVRARGTTCVDLGGLAALEA